MSAVRRHAGAALDYLIACLLVLVELAWVVLLLVFVAKALAWVLKHAA